MNIINNKSMLHGMQKINKISSDANQTQQSQTIDLKQVATAPSFNDFLQQTIEKKSEVQFSKHANMRLSARDIRLSDDQMKRLEDGVSKANSKGINDSLVIVDDVALVVNVKNRIVVTALHKGQDNSVFTNIDGAVIV